MGFEWRSRAQCHANGPAHQERGPLGGAALDLVGRQVEGFRDSRASRLPGTGSFGPRGHARAPGMAFRLGAASAPRSGSTGVGTRRGTKRRTITSRRRARMCPVPLDLGAGPCLARYLSTVRRERFAACPLKSRPGPSRETGPWVGSSGRTGPQGWCWCRRRLP